MPGSCVDVPSVVLRPPHLGPGSGFHPHSPDHLASKAHNTVSRIVLPAYTHLSAPRVVSLPLDLGTGTSLSRTQCGAGSSARVRWRFVVVVMGLLSVLLLLYAYEYVQQAHESGGVSVTRLTIADSTPGSVCEFGVRGLAPVSCLVSLSLSVCMDDFLLSARMDEMSVSSCSAWSILSVCVCPRLVSLCPCCCCCCRCLSQELPISRDPYTAARTCRFAFQLSTGELLLLTGFCRLQCASRAISRLGIFFSCRA